MEKFTNVNIKNESKRLIKNILISILIIFISLALIVWSFVIRKDANNNIKNLNDIIINDKQKENKVASLSIQTQPFPFAEEKDGSNGFFIVMDEQYMYIVYMNKYDELANRTDLRENPANVVGGTKIISQEIRKMALDAYNEGVEKEEEKLDMSDFALYFGDVYLDITSNGTSQIGRVQLIFGVSLAILGILMLIVGIVEKTKFKKAIKNMDDITAKTIDDEINSQDALYYKKIQLYLTNSYIVNFKGMFRVIDYKDIIWMYSRNYYTDDFIKNHSIKVMKKDGKIYEIVAISTATKARKEMYNEIWNTIISKNNRIILGCTKEAMKEARSRIENQF